MTREWTSSFSVTSMHGEVDLSERGPVQSNDDGEGGSYETYTSIELVDVKADKIELSLFRDFDDGPNVTFGLSAFHQENPETERAFHAHLRVTLSRAEARTMRDFLDCLLKLEEVK